MIRKYLLTSVLIVAMLVTGVSVQLLSSHAMAQEGQPDAALAPAADVGASFVYQGYLQQSGTAVEGSCDFEFRLYDSSAGGSQVGGLQARSGQALSQGRFTVELDFGANAFDGQGRWLEIRVRCPSGSGGFTTLSPRQPLTAAPYALSLRPGATVNGSSSAGILNLTNNGSGTGLTVNSATVGVRVLSGTNQGVLVDSAAEGVRVLSAIGSGMQVDSATTGMRVLSAIGSGMQVDSAAEGFRVLSASNGVTVNSATEFGVRVVSAGTGMFVDSATTGMRVLSATGNGVQVDSATQFGVAVQNTGDDGLRVENAGLDGLQISAAGDDGVFVGEAGDDGFQVNSAGDDGLDIQATGDAGLRVRQAGGHGVHIEAAGGAGLRVDSAPNGAGVFVVSADNGLTVGSATNNGVRVDSATLGLRVVSAGNGVQVDAVTGNGMRVFSAPNGSGVVVDSANTGVFVQSATNWAGYFTGNINVTGTCSGCLMATFGVNTGDSPLQPGDVVALQGTRSDESIGQPLLMEVEQAQAGAPLIGVVYGRGELVTEIMTDIEGLDGQAVTQLAPREGAAQPGDYVHIVIYGPVQVKASALSQTIAMGDKLAVNDRGAARSLQTVQIEGVQLAGSAPTIGIALESLEASKDGLIWVLVNPQ